MTYPRPAPIFIGGALALDFLNSLATPVDSPVEWITSGEDLLAWLTAADAVPKDVVASLGRKPRAPELDKAAAEARDLREWFRGFVRRHSGRSLRPEAIKELSRLNEILAKDREYGQIVRNPEAAARSGLAWRPMRHWQTPDTLLLPIARAMADLICNEDFSQVKACEGVTCTLFFIDRTRGQARRWCTMAVCGNRAKQAAHRERQHSS